MPELQLKCSVNKYNCAYGTLNNGSTTVTYNIPEAIKTQMLADHPTWFAEYTALEQAKDETAIAAAVAQAKADASLAATTDAQAIYDALKAISDADATAASDAADAAAAALVAFSG